MANQREGTGKHGHKDTQESYPHHRDQEGGQQASGRQERGSSQRDHQGGSQDGQDKDLKAREYRDKDGNIHHHTHTYMEQHGKKDDGNR